MISFNPPTILLAVLAGILSPAAPAPRTITGIVTCKESSTPLEGAVVGIKGTNRHTGSQPDGIYYIDIKDEDSVLVFSYPGRDTSEVRITTANEYDVALKSAGQK